MFGAKRKPAVEIEAPVKRNSVTCDKLNAAIHAVGEALGPCTARQTFDALYVYDRENGDTVKFDGAPPVTITQFDAALADAQGLDLPAGTLDPLTGVRTLLVKAEEKTARLGAEPVTRAEFDAFVDAVATVVVNIDAAHKRSGYPDGSLYYRLERIIDTSDELGVSNAQRAALQRIVGRADVARQNAGEYERKHARRLPGQPWSR